MTGGAESSPATDPLASLPGIEAARGRERTLGNDKLYMRLLRKFRDTQHDAIERCRAALTAGDIVLARRHAHDLRSVAGSLGAVELERLAQPLEAACHDGADAATVLPLLAAPEAELQRVVAGLRGLPD